MQASGGGGGGHQMRDRKGPGQSTSKAMPKDVSQENVPMSKHQKKKVSRTVVRRKVYNSIYIPLLN